MTLTEFGTFVENELVKKFKKQYPLCYNDNVEGVKNKKWDLIIPEKNISVEVKADYISIGTDNLLIEVVGWDGDAGLTTTKADYWVFVTGLRYIWIRPLEIYRFLETQSDSHNGRESIRGDGDNYNKLAYKVKHDDFVRYIYNNLNPINGYYQLVKTKNDPLFYLNCIKHNSKLEKYKEIAISKAKNEGIL